MELKMNIVKALKRYTSSKTSLNGTELPTLTEEPTPTHTEESTPTPTNIKIIVNGEIVNAIVVTLDSTPYSSENLPTPQDNEVEKNVYFYTCAAAIVGHQAKIVPQLQQESSDEKIRYELLKPKKRGTLISAVMAALRADGEPVECYATESQSQTAATSLEPSQQPSKGSESKCDDVAGHCINKISDTSSTRLESSPHK